MSELQNVPGSVNLPNFIHLILISFSFALFTFLILNTIWRGWKKYGIKLTLLAFIMGFLEIVTYSLSIIANIPVFIAFWITIKTAMKWDLSRWDPQSRYNRKARLYKSMEVIDIEKKDANMRFLFGNFINIILSYLVAVIVLNEFIRF